MTTATTKRSFCRICHAACPVDVEIVDGRPVRVRGVDEDPIFNGYTCIKGRKLPEQINDPARLRAPLKRSAGGTMEELPSDDALDEVAAKLRDIIDRHGGRAVATYTGTGGYQNAPSHPVAQAFHRAIGSIPDVRRGVVSMAHSWGSNTGTDEKVRDIGAPTNRLIDVENGYCPITGQAIQSAIPVSVEPVFRPRNPA